MTRRTSLLAFALALSASFGAQAAKSPTLGRSKASASKLHPAVKSSIPSLSVHQAVTLPSKLQAIVPKSAAQLREQLPEMDWQVVQAAPGKVAPPSKPAADWTGKRVLIVFQENTGQIPLPEGTPAMVESMIETVVDQMAETFEDVKHELQGQGKYDEVVLLTDADCTRAKLLQKLVSYTKKNAIIDLVVLGHGSDDALRIHGDDEGWLLGSPGYDEGDVRHIRKLLPDAQAMGVSKLNLRMVYMCNCKGSTTNDDWLAIGAKVVVAPDGNNYMPEPVPTFFLAEWLGGKKASRAAELAYQGSIPFYTLVFPPTATQQFSSQTVSVPCGQTWKDNGCSATNPFTGKTHTFGCYVVKYCSETVQVPSGVSWSAHPNIASSELVVSGDGSIKFGTPSY